MSYCVGMTKCNFKIREDNVLRAMHKLVNHMYANKVNFIGIDLSRLMNSMDDPIRFLDNLHYSFELIDGYYVANSRNSDYLNDDQKWLSVIAEYIEPDLCIEMYGQDGDKWFWVMEGDECVEKSYENMIKEKLKKKDKEISELVKLIARKELAEEMLREIELISFDGMVDVTEYYRYTINKLHEVLREKS